jgi:hypothetical protein
MDSIKYLGTTDEVTVCDCCGKANLKSTVAISIDEGEPVYFGVTCAARALKTGVSEVKRGTAAADREREEQARIARQAAEAAKSAPWFAFLAAHGTGDNNFSRIESLGGYAAAKARFEAEQGK